MARVEVLVGTASRVVVSLTSSPSRELVMRVNEPLSYAVRYTVCFVPAGRRIVFTSPIVRYCDPGISSRILPVVEA